MFRRRLREKLGREDRNSASLTYSDLSGEKGSADSEWEKVEKKEATPDLDDEEEDMGELEDDHQLIPEPKKEATESKWRSGEKDVFMEQLEVLNEQLLSALTENQELKAELESSSKHGGRSHHKEIDKLKKENRTLQSQVERLQKSGGRRLQSSSSQSSDYGSCGGQSLSVSSTGDGFEAVSVSTSRLQSSSFASSVRKSIWLSLKDKVLNFLADFTEEANDIQDLRQEEPLQVKKLKENIRRLASSSRPGVEFAQLMVDILQWKNKALSLVVFLIYMYCVWNGWVIQLLLLLAIVQLSLNHFYATGLAEQFGFSIPKKNDGDEDEFASMGLSDKYQLVKQVGQTVQNKSGEVSDHLEKGLNLIQWHQPEATYNIYKKLWIAFIVTLFLPNSYILTVIGLGVGVKLFIVDNIYRKYPKVKDKYDGLARLWRSLPTKAELEQRQAMTEEEMRQRIRARMSSSSSSLEDDSDFTSLSSSLTFSELAFCDRFQVGQDELPLENWQNGKRCTLLDKEHPLKGSKNGRLYLTQNLLCFERSTQLSERSDRFSVALKDVATIKKAKPFAVMPGSGMSIEIHLKSGGKPLLFGAILHRDQVFRQISDQGMVCGLPWGSDPERTGLEPPTDPTPTTTPSSDLAPSLASD